MTIQFPIIVDKITIRENEPYSQGWRKDSIGQFVAIRPVQKDFGNKTYLGIYLGELTIMGPEILYNSDENELKVSRGYGNPAIYVFDLKRIIFGYESWWGVIKDEDDMRKITDADINDIWYVKALKQLASEDNNENNDQGEMGGL